MAEKRARSVNWDSEEKQLLREIMKEHLNVLNVKNNDTFINKRKAQAWQEITKKFNDVNFRSRELKQIYNQWKVMKTKSKKEMGEYKKHCRLTGGGPKPTSPSHETLEMVSLDPTGFLYPENPYDSDNFVVSYEPQIEIKDTVLRPAINIFALERSDAAIASTSGNSLAAAAGVVSEFCSDAELLTATTMPPATASFTASSDAGAAAATTTTTVTTTAAAVTTTTTAAAVTTTTAAVTTTTTTTPTPVAGAATPSRLRRDRKMGEFDFKKRSFESMERYRAKENERLEKEHLLRVQWAKEQHDKLMSILCLQEEILYKQLQK